MQAAGAVAMGLVMNNVFLIAHDAGHGSFTGSRSLNRHIARLTFLICLHPSNPWITSHNKVHHAFTNLKGADFVWLPLSKQEYDGLGLIGRAAERASRRTPGFGLGYVRQVWWSRLMRPDRDDPTRRRLGHVVDRLLVVAAIAVLTRAAVGAGGGPWRVACVVVIPFVILTWTIGFVVYFNHTHPDVPWFADRGAWSHLVGQVDGTVHVRFPACAAPFLGNIMNHAAHHVHPGVPLVNLAAAQARLDHVLATRSRSEVWTLSVHARIVRVCKLYDYEAMRWLDFRGRPTSEPSQLAQPLLEAAHA
jgi:omega-6 fatty acid desaturase (delta-12 desaturase)